MLTFDMKFPLIPEQLHNNYCSYTTCPRAWRLDLSANNMFISLNVKTGNVISYCALQTQQLRCHLASAACVSCELMILWGHICTGICDFLYVHNKQIHGVHNNLFFKFIYFFLFMYFLVTFSPGTTRDINRNPFEEVFTHTFKTAATYKHLTISTVDGGKKHAYLVVYS